MRSAPVLARLLFGVFLVLAAPAGAASEFETQLLRLAARALAEGDLATAGNRYQRVLDANRDSAPARAGLGSVAMREGRTADAERWFEEAVAIAPGARGARLGLAQIAAARGAPDVARGHLEAALAAAPLDPLLHQRLLDLTGLAPGAPPVGAEAVRARAARHPYDPRAQLAAAELAQAAGDVETARAAALTALLVADLAPDAAPAAARLLAALDGSGERRFVPVHVYADESVREREGFRFELRIAWGRAARALEPVLQTTFVPVSIRPFSTAEASDRLDAIHAALLSDIGRPPLDGILAGFTRRRAPGTATARRLGQASYLGRELVVRLDPSDLEGRTLAHEILHLYGGIHVADAVSSLMNPSGGAWQLDPYNARIAEATRRRRFGPGSFERNVLERVDEAELADALVAGLDANVRLRRSGLREAMEEARTSRFSGQRLQARATGQDRHLGDVARLSAFVLARNERVPEAVVLLESAARLYGPRSRAGRMVQAEADRLRAAWQAQSR